MTASLVAVFLWRLVATAAIVVIVNRIAARGGPVLASVVMALPVNAGPGFLFLAFEHDAAFISQGAITTLASIGCIMLFAGAYSRLTRWFDVGLCLVGSIGAWALLALPMQAVRMDLELAAAWICVGFSLSWFLARRRRLPPPAGRPRAQWPQLLFRASLAGLMVATVSVSGGWLGPVLSGLALGFPITFSAGIWVLHRDYGGDFAAATMAAMPRSMVSFLAFALTLHLLSGPLTAIHALGLALVASLVVAGGLALLVQARRPRPAA